MVGQIIIPIKPRRVVEIKMLLQLPVLSPSDILGLKYSEVFQMGIKDGFDVV